MQAARSDDRDFHKLYKLTSGICFFSTPHRGSYTLGLLPSFTSQGRIEPIQPILQSLYGHKIWTRTSNEFQRIGQQIRILSCWETRRTTTWKGRTIVCLTSLSLSYAELIWILKIVDRDSAVLGAPNETAIPIDADQTTICKFDSREDPGYQQFVHFLMRRWSEAGRY